jgi:hypothetical protein
MEKSSGSMKPDGDESGDPRTEAQRAHDKGVYWEAQVQWWQRWAGEHGLGLDGASSGSVHLAFMRRLATQAAQEHQRAREPKPERTMALPPRKTKKTPGGE